MFLVMYMYVQLANVVVPSNQNFDKEMTVLIQKQVMYNLCEYCKSLRKLCMHYILPEYSWYFNFPCAIDPS